MDTTQGEMGKASGVADDPSTDTSSAQTTGGTAATPATTAAEVAQPDSTPVTTPAATSTHEPTGHSIPASSGEGNELSEIHNAKQWMYLDGVDPTQRGPFAERVMLKLLRAGTAHKEMLAWSQGMAEWQKLGEIDAFRETSELAATPWMYLGENSEQQGPVSATALALLLRRGQVDGMTMAWTTGMGEWKPLGEVSEVRALLHGDDEDDEEDDEEVDGVEGGVSAGAGNLPPGVAHGQQGVQQMMVFEGEEEGQPAYEPPPSKQSKRSFMADDGTKFAWDEEKGDWKQVEGDEEEELEDDEEVEEEAWKVRRAKQQAKAKAKAKELKAAKGGQQQQNGAAMSAAPTPADNGIDDNDPDTAHWGEFLEDAKKEAEREGSGEGVEAGEEGADPAAAAAAAALAAQRKAKKKSGKKKRGASWNKKANNLWVYVKGLPIDVTMEEVREHFNKCGIIATDPLTQQPKIKIYKDPEGYPKGDGSVCYVKMESVEMAINVLHEGQLRPGVSIEVSKAVFEQKGTSFDHSKRLRVNDARVKVARAAAEQALSWAENDDTGAAKGGLKIVVVENMFQPSDFEKNEKFGEELEADLLEEGGKLGPVEKITVFAKNTMGPVVIKFGTAYAASECVKVFDGRFFGGRKLSCHFWDGVTNYIIKEEDEQEEAKRLDVFGDWLEEQELPEELRPRTEA